MNTAKEVFLELFSSQQLADRFVSEGGQAGIDVVIPVLHSNILWEANLHSIYREIPVNRLLLGDAGCVDDTLKIASRFPRVVVVDQRNFRSLGYSIKNLIQRVETEWFAYLHSDVYLPEGWYDAMQSGRKDFDWYECSQVLTYALQIKKDYSNYNRALSGSQIGRTAILKAAVERIEDDFLYRNEDIIIADLVEKRGGRYGRVLEAYHLHEVTHRQSPRGRFVRDVNLVMEKSPEEQWDELDTMIKGIVKYCEPEGRYVDAVQAALVELMRIKLLNARELTDWIESTRPEWIPRLPLLKTCLGASNRFSRVKLSAVKQDIIQLWKSLFGLFSRSYTFRFRDPDGTTLHIKFDPDANRINAQRAGEDAKQ